MLRRGETRDFEWLYRKVEEEMKSIIKERYRGRIHQKPARIIDGGGKLILPFKVKRVKEEVTKDEGEEIEKVESNGTGVIELTDEEIKALIKSGGYKAFVEDALKDGRIEDVKRVIELGGDPNVVLKGNKKLIDYAIEKGDVDLAKFLLSKGVKLPKDALMKSVKAGLEVVKALLELGFGVDKVDGRGNTLLHYVVSEGKLDVVKELIRHKARMDRINSEGKSPIDIAIEKNSGEILGYFKYFLRDGYRMQVREDKIKGRVYGLWIPQSGKVWVAKVEKGKDKYIITSSGEELGPFDSVQ